MVGVVLLYYAVTSGAAVALGAVQPVTGIPTLVLTLAQFGPTVGMLAVLPLLGAERHGALAVGSLRDARVGRLLLLAAAIVAAVVVVTTAGYTLLGRPISATDVGALAQPMWLIAPAQLLGAAGEELGWRSFLQPYLQRRLPVLTSSIVVGVLWGLWHPGALVEGLGFGVAFLVASVALSVILGEHLRHAHGNNLMVAAVFHALVNLSMLLLFGEEDGDEYAMWALAIAFGVAAAVAVLANRVRGRGEGAGRR
jgi:membrane protease YdiL (CAAX protease family)